MTGKAIKSLLCIVVLFWSITVVAHAESVDFDRSMKLSVGYAGYEQQGYLAYLNNDCLVLHTFEGAQSIPTALIEQIAFGDEKLSGDAIQGWIKDLEHSQRAEFDLKNNYHHAMRQAQWLTALSPAVGKFRMAAKDNQIKRMDWIGLATFDGVLVGGALYGIYGAEHWGIVLPFASTLVLFRIWAVKDIQIGYTTDYQDRIQMEDSCGLR